LQILIWEVYAVKLYIAE